MQPIETETLRPAEARPPIETPTAVDDPRVYLAAERTFLAWVRTSLALMGFGFLIARFGFWLREYVGVPGERAPSHHIHTAVSPWLGFGMVLVGVFVLVMATVRHLEYIRALERGVANPSLGVGTSLVVAVILTIVGLTMAVLILLF